MGSDVDEVAAVANNTRQKSVSTSKTKIIKPKNIY